MTSALSFALLWLVAVMTPGPNVILISGSALDSSRRVTVLTLAGILCDTVVWGLAGFFGIGLLFRAAPWLYISLKLASGAYIVYLGAKLLLKGPSHEVPPPSIGRSAGA